MYGLSFMEMAIHFYISCQIITDILQKIIPDDTMRRTIIRSMAMEGILGHMATHSIHSIEAGLILIADGCDMTKGHARIALEIPNKPKKAIFTNTQPTLSKRFA